MFDLVKKSKTKVWPEKFRGEEILLFRGRPLRLRFIENSTRPSIHIEEPKPEASTATESVLTIESHPDRHGREQIQEALLGWFKAKLEAQLRSLLAIYLPKIPKGPKKIRIRPFKGQWGSCHPNGTVKLNFNLVFTPPETLEYVLVHELAHLKHMNHSRDFWKHVGELLPDYKKRQKLLKNFSAVLYWQKVPATH